MSKWGKELRNLRSWPAVFALSYYLALLVFVLQSNEPRNLFFLNEQCMLPLVVMLTYVWFQREIVSGLMEMIATYPVSLAGMLMRKWLLVQVSALACHALLMAVYYLRFGPLKALMFPWDGGAAVKRAASWWELYAQALPGYVIISSLAVFGFVLTKQLYGGLLFSFAYWTLEGLTSGSLTREMSLYTAYLPHEEWFWLNRLWLLTAGGVLGAWAIVLINQRSRWIKGATDE